MTPERSTDAARSGEPGMVERVAEMVWDRGVDFEHVCSWEEALNTHDLRLIIVHLMDLSEGYITAVLDALAADFPHSVIVHGRPGQPGSTCWEETVPQWAARIKGEVQG